MGGLAHDAGVVHVDRIGNHAGCGIGLRSGGRKHGHAVGDAKRKAAPAPAAGGHTAHRHGVGDFKCAVQLDVLPPPVRWQARQVGIQTHASRLPGCEVQGNVAAVVDPSAGHARPVVAGDQALRHAAGHSGHGRDEVLRRPRQAGLPHAPRHRALQRAGLMGLHRQTQHRPLLHQLIEQGYKTRPGAFMGILHRRRALGPHRIGADHDVHRAVLKVPAAIG